VKNVLNCFPKQMAAAVKSDLDDIQHAETRSEAETALIVFSEKYGVKYDKGVACLTKDKEEMLAFFDFPADHRGHMRTTNPPSRACKHALSGNNRKRLRHGPAQSGPHQRRTVTKDRKADGIHPDPGRIKKMAASQRQKPVAKSHRRNQVQ